MAFLRCFSLLLFCLVFSSSCGLVPWPVSAIQATVDIITWNNVGKTTSEIVASEIVKEDCLWVRVFDDGPVCMTKVEELDYLFNKKCDVYTWNWLGIPQCAKDIKE